MSFLKILWRVELRAVAALVICACLMAIYGMADSLRMLALGLSPLLGPLGAAWIGFGYTLTIGALPTIFYGAPVYAFLHYKGKASWPVVLLVGVVPGLVAFPLVSPPDRDLAGWSMLCGVVVAGLTHLLSSRGKLQLVKQR